MTINLPRIAYLAEGEADFYRRLDRLMDIAARSLKTKRMVITKLMEGGLYPYTRRYLGTFENHFSTIGLVGMNEAGLNAKWLRKDLTHPETQAFAKDVLNHMRQRLSDYQEQYGDLYNLEATPAESTAYRLAKHDKMLYPDIITANENGTPYYTNSSHLPVGYTEDIFSALDVQDELQTLYTSGTVFHAFLGEKLPDWKAAASLVRKIAENYRLPYYTLSPTYSVCKTTAILQESSRSAPSAARKQRSTAASPVITAPCRTGTTARRRNLRSQDIRHRRVEADALRRTGAGADTGAAGGAAVRSGRAVCDKDLPELQAGRAAAGCGRHPLYGAVCRGKPRHRPRPWHPAGTDAGIRRAEVDRRERCAGVYCRKGERKCMRF